MAYLRRKAIHSYIVFDSCIGKNLVRSHALQLMFKHKTDIWRGYRVSGKAGRAPVLRVQGQWCSATKLAGYLYLECRASGIQQQSWQGACT